MNTHLSSVRISCVCKHCGQPNDLKAADVHVDDAVACSSCRKPLGTISDLKAMLPAPVEEPTPVPAE